MLARHAHDHNRRHLAVTVLQAKGLAPRRGVVVALRWVGVYCRCGREQSVCCSRNGMAAGRHSSAVADVLTPAAANPCVASPVQRQ